MLKEHSGFRPNLDVSQECASAFLSIASGENNECLNLSALLSAFTSPDQSIVTPVDNWLEGMCSRDRCSDDTINAMFDSVSQACSSEAERFSITLDQNSKDLVGRVYVYLTVTRNAD